MFFFSNKIFHKNIDILNLLFNKFYSKIFALNVAKKISIQYLKMLYIFVKRLAINLH